MAATALLLGSLTLVGPVRADDDPLSLAGTVTFGSDYVYRGISQTDNDPTVQGSLEVGYALSEKFSPYVSLWGSNVDFKTGGSENASLELDATLGARGTFVLTEKLGLEYDASVIYYLYPKSKASRDFNFVEFGAWAGLATPWLTPGVGYRYSPDFFASTGDASYLYGTLTIPVPLGLEKYEVSLNGRFGRQWIQDNSKFGARDYNEWSAGVTLSYVPWDLSLTAAWQDTNLSKSECFGGTKLCQSRGVVTLTKSF
ncbi:MAG: TorF family putative porin [Alphaproteobacteria bacterium]|nr:TorF family putative porin [Alphaproteobacteria bacterium]